MGVLGRPRWEPRGCLDLGSNKTLRHENESRTKNPRNPKMSYYRYITGVYKSYWPELNRTLRSSSVPRTVPDLDSSRYVRGTSMPPNAYFSDSHSPYVASCFYSSRRNVASPFADRALSVPPSTFTSGYSSSSSASSSHYSDFDCKVTTKLHATTTSAGIIQRTAFPLGTIIMMETSTAVMASTRATRTFSAHGSTTTSPPRLWPLETREQGARSSPENLTGILRLGRE